MLVAVIGIYPDRSGIERVEVHHDLDAARQAVKRWLTQHYCGTIEVWAQRPWGTAESLDSEVPRG